MGEGTMVTDELKKLIGVTGEPVIYKIEEGAITRYAEAIDDSNPFFNDVEAAKNSRYGRLICPPGFTGWPLKVGRPSVKLFEKLIKAGAPPRVLDGGAEFEFFLPVGAGDILVASTRIHDISEREGRMGKMIITTLSTTFWNQNGDVALTSRTTFINL